MILFILGSLSRPLAALREGEERESVGETRCTQHRRVRVLFPAVEALLSSEHNAHSAKTAGV